MNRLLTLPAVLVAGLFAPPAMVADFEWHEALHSGATLEVKGISGDIKASVATGDEASVSAHKSAGKDDPESVQIHVVPSASGVTICAVYPPAHGAVEPGCPDSHDDLRKSDVRVDFEVRLPKGVRFRARTVNGSIAAGRLESDVDAHAVNGGVRLETTGFAEAESVNGNVDATLGAVPPGSHASFRSVNGSIRLTLPRAVDARISAHTVNGAIHTALPLETTEHRVGSTLKGTLGTGSADLSIDTVNGSVTIAAAP
jgi:hypothetical protein